MEIWKDIKGYEGLYQVSNLGRVKSLGNDSNNFKEKILKQWFNSKNYLLVGLTKNKKHKFYLVHRLVAEAFISNPNNLPQVNHKDENRQNNFADNLEFCTNKYNVRYSQAKKICQYDKEGNLIKEWDCISDAANELNIKITNISACCRRYGRVKSAGGYVWKYKDAS